MVSTTLNVGQIILGKLLGCVLLKAEGLPLSPFIKAKLPEIFRAELDRSAEIYLYSISGFDHTHIRLSTNSILHRRRSKRTTYHNG